MRVSHPAAGRTDRVECVGTESNRQSDLRVGYNHLGSPMPSRRVELSCMGLNRRKQREQRDVCRTSKLKYRFGFTASSLSLLLLLAKTIAAPLPVLMLVVDALSYFAVRVSTQIPLLSLFPPVQIQVQPIVLSTSHLKCPRQESNLVYDLRRVACLHHTPGTGGLRVYG